MRKILALTALAASFALLACGSDVDEADTEVVDAGAETEMAADNSTAMGSPTSQEPINAVTLADNDVSGTYSMTDADGSASQLTLNPDNTYTYTRADGQSFNGRYGFYDDYRLQIEDFDGSDAYFSFDNSSLYRLASETSLPQDRITVTAQYDRSDNTNASQTGGPGATTNNVADKRGKNAND